MDKIEKVEDGRLKQISQCQNGEISYLQDDEITQLNTTKDYQQMLIKFHQDNYFSWNLKDNENSQIKKYQKNNQLNYKKWNKANKNIINEEEISKKQQQIRGKKLDDLFMDEQNIFQSKTFEKPSVLKNDNKKTEKLIKIYEKSIKKEQQIARFNKITQSLDKFPELNNCVKSFLAEKNSKKLLNRLLELTDNSVKFYLLKDVFQEYNQTNLWQENKMKFALNCAVIIARLKDEKELMNKILKNCF